MTTIAHAHTQRSPQTPTPRDVARLLAISDERDRWHQAVLDAWREGYAAGKAARPPQDCDCCPADVTGPRWPLPRSYHRAIPGVESFAVMDRRRYPPAGRRAWLIARGLPPYDRLRGDAARRAALVGEGVAGSPQHAGQILAAIAREVTRLDAAWPGTERGGSLDDIRARTEQMLAA